ncbi:MAG: response regulator [Candidatus Omnitrophica bacterium]|nr:response regulator [Candidatus Omnitrophota bacterium]
MSEHKILVVEDDEDHRFIIGECLKESGFTNLIFAVSGEEGMEKVKSEKPAIVVTDTNLGRMNGFEVCRRIKKEFPKVKVLIMTGNARYVDFPKARTAGADEYKVKTGDCGEIIWGLKRCVSALAPKKDA